MIIISNYKNVYVIDQMLVYLDSYELFFIYKFFFVGLEIISNVYYFVIEEMDKSKDEISVLLC